MSEDTQFKPKRKKTGGRKAGTKNKATLFRYFIQEMDSKGVDLYQMWLDALNKGDEKIANAISKAFPHISQRPSLDVNLDTDVDQLVIVLNHGEDKKKDEAGNRTTRASNKGVPKP